MNLKIQKKGKVVFKTYHQNQLNLLPASLDELIPSDHLVKIVDGMIERISMVELEKFYVGGGSSSYHPKLMLKVLVYAYCERIYSSRRIAKALRENVMFMWIAGQQCPDFRTINDFRKDRMKQILEVVFSQVVDVLIEEGYVDLEDYFVDGTKWSANANKYSHVWAKNTRRYKQGVQRRIQELFLHIDQVNETEQARYQDQDLPEMGSDQKAELLLNSEVLEKHIDQLNEQINQQAVLAKSEGKKTTKQSRQLSNIYNKLSQEAEKLSKYEQQEKILSGRSSYSKTDEQATFMRMKNDALLPGYNVQIGGQHQYILNYSIHQNANDAMCFKEHMEKFSRLHPNKKPKRINGDSIYGTEENYEYLQDQQIENYLKFPSFHKEQCRKFQQNPYRRENFSYDPKQDVFICPNDKKLSPVKHRKQITKTGYTQRIKIYECEDCSDCPMAEDCKRSQKNRTIQISEKLEAFKQQARQNLHSDKGLDLRSRRGVEIETPFADIKQNQAYTRFRLRGLKKVEIEMGILCLSHNLRKLCITKTIQKHLKSA